MTAWLRKGYVMPVPETAVKCTMYVYALPVQGGSMNFIGMDLVWGAAWINVMMI